jgi:hypothetical protein
VIVDIRPKWGVENRAVQWTGDNLTDVVALINNESDSPEQVGDMLEFNTGDRANVGDWVVTTTTGLWSVWGRRTFDGDFEVVPAEHREVRG